MNYRAIRTRGLIGAACAALLLSVTAAAWDRFDDLPGAKLVKEAQRRSHGPFRSDRAEVTFDPSGNIVYWRDGEQWYSMSLPGGTPTTLPKAPEIPKAPEPPSKFPTLPPAPPPPGRGRQATVAIHPDGKRTAKYENHNITIVGGAEGDVPVTTDGKDRIRYGCASWVYGEELDQVTAMWWSPSGRYLAFYKFDDTPVKDFVLLNGLTRLRPEPMLEPYPKPGEPNPIAGLMIYDTETRKTVTVDVGPNPDQYIYWVKWTPDSAALMFNRTNRRQDLLEVMLADPATGQSRVLITEKQETFQENHPGMKFLSDGRRFIWESERSGYKQFELWDVEKGRVAELTHGSFPVQEIVKIDEPGNRLWYTAFGSDIRINPQLFVAKLDGTGERRLTPEDHAYSAFKISSDGKWFSAIDQFVDVPPAVKLYEVGDSSPAKQVAVLHKGDDDPWAKVGAQKPEFFTCPAADGATPLYGILQKPSNFDPSKRYPLLVKVYGGPGIQTISPHTAAPDPECEFGVLVARVDNRGTPGRGKAFEGATYLKLGGPDIDDQAAAVKYLTQRPYVDGAHVGITGHSYGGYATVIALLRHPETFTVGVAGAPPTDWRNYDSIYTERYMRLPNENSEGYDAGSAVKLADHLKGHLLIIHGMIDDNVHPTNAWQLVDQLEKKNIPFEMLFFPNSNHGVGGPAADGARWSFLLKHLGLLDKAPESVTR